MCIWCLRDGVFSDDDWAELLHETRRSESLIDPVKQFFRTAGTRPVVSGSEECHLKQPDLSEPK